MRSFFLLSGNGSFLPNGRLHKNSYTLGALAYFISPIDAIPDITPGIGYTDDFAVMTTAVATVSTFINEDVKKQAMLKLTDWFG